MDKQQITEEQKVHEAWYADAKSMTLDKIPEFMRHLAEDYGHDYGTICHAIAASAIAAASAMDSSAAGGITGFQTGAVMWEFISHWMHYEGKPLRLINYQDMLYPQYREKFLQISAETWKWLQEEAKKLIATAEPDGYCHPDVERHWKSIAAGVVPFGYAVEQERPAHAEKGEEAKG